MVSHGGVPRDKTKQSMLPVQSTNCAFERACFPRGRGGTRGEKGGHKSVGRFRVKMRVRRGRREKQQVREFANSAQGGRHRNAVTVRHYKANHKKKKYRNRYGKNLRERNESLVTASIKNFHSGTKERETESETMKKTVIEIGRVGPREQRSTSKHTHNVRKCDHPDAAAGASSQLFRDPDGQYKWDRLMFGPLHQDRSTTKERTNCQLVIWIWARHNFSRLKTNLSFFTFDDRVIKYFSPRPDRLAER